MYWKDRENPYALLEYTLQVRGIPMAVVAIDDAVAVGILVPILQRFPKIRIVLASRVLASLLKDAQEAQYMREGVLGPTRRCVQP